MGLLNRGATVPDDVLSQLALPRRDVLGASPSGSGWLIASVTELLAWEHGASLRRAWTDVDAARATAEPPALHVTWVDGAAPLEAALEPRESRRLLRVVHERVQASVVHTERVELPHGRTVRVVLRRASDGSLFTQVIGPGGVDLADPAVAEPVDAAERRVRESAGLT